MLNAVDSKKFSYKQVHFITCFRLFSIPSLHTFEFVSYFCLYQNIAGDHVVRLGNSLPQHGQSRLSGTGGGEAPVPPPGVGRAAPGERPAAPGSVPIHPGSPRSIAPARSVGLEAGEGLECIQGHFHSRTGSLDSRSAAESQAQSHGLFGPLWLKRPRPEAILARK